MSMSHPQQMAGGRARRTIPVQWNLHFEEMLDQVHISWKRLCWKFTIHKFLFIYTAVSVSSYELMNAHRKTSRVITSAPLSYVVMFHFHLISLMLMYLRRNHSNNPSLFHSRLKRIFSTSLSHHRFSYSTNRTDFNCDCFSDLLCSTVYSSTGWTFHKSWSKCCLCDCLCLCVSGCV